MAGVVLDCSVAVAWTMGEVHEDALQGIFQLGRREGYHVPSVWRLEVCNAFLSTLRAGKVDMERFVANFSDLGAIRVMIDNKTEHLAWTTTRDYALKHKLTSYDAAYIDLAVRKKAVLATLDKALARAAKVEGLHVLPN